MEIWIKKGNKDEKKMFEFDANNFYNFKETNQHDLMEEFWKRVRKFAYLRRAHATGANFNTQKWSSARNTGWQPQEEFENEIGFMNFWWPFKGLEWNFENEEFHRFWVKYRWKKWVRFRL